MKPSAILTYFITLFMLAATSVAETWQKAEIYFIDWDVMTRASLSPEQVRNRAKSKRTVGADKASEMATFLKIYDLRTIYGNNTEDTRLVVDFYTDTGDRITHFASRFHLCSADGTRKRPIDDDFRQYFRMYFQPSSK